MNKSFLFFFEQAFHDSPKAEPLISDVYFKPYPVAANASSEKAPRTLVNWEGGGVSDVSSHPESANYVNALTGSHFKPTEAANQTAAAPLTGTNYFNAFPGGAAGDAAERAKKAELDQSEAAHRAAEFAAAAYAFQAEKAAIEASSAVAVEQERAARVSDAAQMAQSAAYTAGRKVAESAFSLGLKVDDTYFFPFQGLECGRHCFFLYNFLGKLCRELCYSQTLEKKTPSATF